MTKRSGFITTFALMLFAAGQAAATPTSLHTQTPPEGPKTLSECKSIEIETDRKKCYERVPHAPMPVVEQPTSEGGWWLSRFLHRIGIGL
ncbi:MAG: hypothetical protein ABUL73_04770 [Alphaproteobacteria bacterium]